VPHVRLDEILHELRAKLARELGGQLSAVFLYGSQARGDASDDSDIDVLVVLEGAIDHAELIRRTSRIVSDLSLKWDVTLSRAFVSKERFQHEDSPFLLNVRREGVAV